MSLRRAFLSLLGATVVAIGGAGLWPAPAMASTGILVEVTQYGVSPNTNVGLVSVTIAASSPLTSLDVSVSSGGTDVLDLPMSDFIAPANDGNSQYGTWTLSAPITTGQLSIGSYAVSVTASDQGGDQVSAVPVGPLNFLNVVQYPTFTSSGTSVNYFNQDVTFSGQAVLLAPDGTTTPYAEKTLTVFGETSQPAPTVVTGSDGSFSVTVPVLQGGNFFLYSTNDSTTIGTVTASVTLTVQIFTVKITATAQAPRVNEGAPDSVSGTVTFSDDGVWKPMAGTTVGLYDGDYSPSVPPRETAVADSNGDFTMPLKTTRSFNWGLHTAQTLYFRQGNGGVSITVAKPVIFKKFHASLSPFAVVTVSAGCISANSGRVRIEYAPKPSGPWQPLGTLPLAEGNECIFNGHEAAQFFGHFQARLAAAYYRAVYLATPDWQTTASPVIFLDKLLTKITSFSVTPRSVARNGRITVSGRLWARGAAGKWLPYRQRRVIVVFRYQGAWYRYKAEPVTNATGRFKARLVAVVSSPYFAQYNGDATHFASASERIGVSVTGAAPATGAAPMIVPWPVIPEPLLLRTR